MNLPMTSKENIIIACQKMVEDKGLTAINMRSVAKVCQVSVGAMYNYFPSKTDLLCATIESIWKDIFHMSNQPFIFTDFIECLTWLFDSIQTGGRKYPEFLSRHAMALAEENKGMGHNMMQKYVVHLKDNLHEVLKKDKNVRSNAFNENLDSELFIGYIFELFMSSVSNARQDYRGILELARIYLYGSI